MPLGKFSSRREQSHIHRADVGNHPEFAVPLQCSTKAYLLMAPITTIRLTPGRRVALAFFGSIATVVSYLCAVSNGIAAGALIGLPSRVGEVIVAQRHARYWMYVAVGLQLLVIASEFTITTNPLRPKII